MSGFVEGIDRSQSTLFPATLDDYVAEDNLVRAVDAFVEGLDLGKLGFGRVAPLGKGLIIRRRCSRYTFTAISIAFRRAAAWSGNASATSSWSG